VEDIDKANPAPAGKVGFAVWNTRALELAGLACIPDIW